MKISLQNYRPFRLDSPLEFEFEDDITFILGKNNIGKSAFIRAFTELRPFVDGSYYARDSKQVNVALGVTFDAISNRSTMNDPVILKIENGNSSWEHKISVKDDQSNMHSKNLTCHISANQQATGTSMSDAEPIHGLFHSSMYIPAFRSAESTLSEELYGIQIGKAFTQMWNNWANSENILHSQKTTLLETELCEILNFRKFSISVSSDRNSLFIATEEGRFKLSELGDGIAHYVICLANALIKEPEYIFIDEPENGLHPKMQENFIRALADKAKKGLVATSHSIALARSTADRIFTMTKDDIGRRQIQPFGSANNKYLVQSISELSYSQHTELGGNHLLLVEGRTDIKAFREILRKYSIEQHFIVWSLNGSDWIKSNQIDIIDELSELKRLNPKSISVVVDSERNSEGATPEVQITEFEKTCNGLGFQTFLTDYHSTENYISQEALDKHYGVGNYVACDPYQHFKELPKRWHKAQNWRLFRLTDKLSIDKTSLGKFIREKLLTQI